MIVEVVFLSHVAHYGLEEEVECDESAAHG